MTTTPQADKTALYLIQSRDETVYAQESLVRELTELVKRATMELDTLKQGFMPTMAGHFVPQALKVEQAHQAHKQAWQVVTMLENLHSTPVHP